MKTVLCLPAVVFSVSAACFPVTGSRILGRDLALADPRLATLPPGLVVGFTPTPGSQRVYRSSEIDRITRSSGIRLTGLPDLCFQFALRRITEREAVRAMQDSLPEGATVRVHGVDQTEVPAGDIRFPISGLEAPGTPDRSQLWRGFVLYAENRRAPVWAQVELAVPVKSVVALTDLPAEIAVDPSALRLVTAQTSAPAEFSGNGMASSVEEVAGRAPRVAVKAGTRIRRADLIEPPAVRRGGSIRVEVRSGTARLHFYALADAPARVGETVELRNPLSGKLFKARIESPSNAVIIIPGLRQSL